MDYFKKGNLALGVKYIRTAEQRKAISDRMKGNVNGSGNKGKPSNRRGKPSWNKGLTKETSEGVRKQAERIKGSLSEKKGIKLSKEHCERISKRLKGRYSPMKGKKHTEESKIKNSESHKGKPPGNKGKSKYPPLDFNLIKFCKCGCGKQIRIQNHHRDRGVPNYISGHNCEFPFRNTSIEVKLQEALRKEGIEFKTHKSIFGQPDIFIEPNICIFADGDYWHANSKDYKKDEVVHSKKTAQDIWNKDKKVNESLIKDGYIVLRFWENEINNNISNIIDIIKRTT